MTCFMEKKTQLQKQSGLLPLSRVTDVSLAVTSSSSGQELGATLEYWLIGVTT
jgi:hypothetical protein